MPTLSSTMTMTRENGEADPIGSASRMVCGEVVRDRSRRADRGDGVLEHELVGAVDLDDHGEAIEILDAAFELASVEQMHDDGEAIAARVVQEHVLDVGLSGGRSLLSWPELVRGGGRPRTSASGRSLTDRLMHDGGNGLRVRGSSWGRLRWDVAVVLVRRRVTIRLRGPHDNASDTTP